METHHLQLGNSLQNYYKGHIFNSYVSHYQRVYPIKPHETTKFLWFFLWFSDGFPMVFPWQFRRRDADLVDPLVGAIHRATVTCKTQPDRSGKLFQVYQVHVGMNVTLLLHIYFFIFISSYLFLHIYFFIFIYLIYLSLFIY